MCCHYHHGRPEPTVCRDVALDKAEPFCALHRIAARVRDDSVDDLKAYELLYDLTSTLGFELDMGCVCESLGCTWEADHTIAEAGAELLVCNTCGDCQRAYQ